MASLASRGRVAILTGGNSGMGKGVARNLVETGWKVAIADINENEEFARELGGAASFHKCNVADYDDQAKVFQQVWDKHGRIDALCANAGILDRSSIYVFGHRGSDKIPPKPNLLCTDVNYKGIVYGTQLAVYFMRKNKVPGGKIIATSSVSGVEPHEAYPEYAGTKAGVVNFVRATARLLKAKENITINTVLPGMVHTSIIPQEMIDAVSPGILTPVSTIVSAYERFLNDDSLNGRAVECSVDKHFFIEPPKLANGPTSKRVVTVYDPHFRMLHGENSGLPDAIA